MMPSYVPPNCRFELDDAELEWTFKPDSFDFVHMRYLMGAISDWGRLYKQAYTYDHFGSLVVASGHLAPHFD